MKINRCQISGKIVEHDLSYIPGSGTPVLKLRILIDDGYYDTKNQKYVKRNIYRTAKYINDLADKLGVREDDWVFVEGSNATDKWQDRDGNDKYTDYIRATVVYEIPNPWDLKEAKSSGGGRDDRDRDRRDDRRGNDRGDDRRSSGRDRRDDRDRDRGRDRDPDPRRDYPGPNDEIPF